jgi:CheY-like chemotaxis protein
VGRVSGGRILVVDDDALLRSSVADVLEDEGYVVDHATDGVDALAKIAASTPDAILLDVLMPRMNGKQLLEALRGDPVTAHIPVLMMTAIQGFDPHRTLALGAAEVVEKPFDIDELLNKIALAVYRARSSRGTDAPGAARPAGPPTAAGVPGGGVVLVLDEDHQVVALLDHLLSGLGFTTVSMSQASDDLPRLARVLEPHAILLDLRLGGGGLAALRLLRAEPALARVPVLAFASSYRELDRVRPELEALRAEGSLKAQAVDEVVRFLATPPRRPPSTG